MATKPDWSHICVAIKTDIDCYTVGRYPDFVSIIFMDHQAQAVMMQCCRPGVKNSFTEALLLDRREFDQDRGATLIPIRVQVVLGKLYPKIATMDGDKEYDEIIAAQELMEATDGKERQG